MSIEKLINGQRGTEVIVLGNEAVARGAVEAGVWVVSTYPGTPSSEIADTLAELSKSFNFDFEYSVNEIVASEVAGAVAIYGGRSMVIFKGAGFFVASDAIFHLGVAGISGSLVIVACDDPSAHSSGDEYDMRMLSHVGSIPAFVPSTPREAKEMTIEAFKLSEKIHLPVMVRLSTRICHQTGIIELGDIPKKARVGINWEKMNKERLRYVIPGGAFVRMGIARQIEGINNAKELCEKSKYNKFIKEESDIGILTCGVTHSYALDALKHLNLKASIFKVSVSFPIPERELKEFFQGIKKLFVVEELAPYLELYARAFAKEVNHELEIFGKENGYFPKIGEYDPSVVIKVLSKVLMIDAPIDYDELETNANALKKIAFPRFPVLCSGCPHRATFYAIKRATKGKAVIMQDVGCYAMAEFPPFELGNINLCMGSSLGAACGFNYISDKPVVSVIGDSTFFHAGLPGLVNSIYNQANFSLIIVDNHATGMTGFQPNPGTGIRVSGKQGKRVIIEDVVQGIGVEDIRTVNSFDIKELQRAIKESIAFNGLSVVVSRGECAQTSKRKKKGKTISYRVEPDKCNGCWICIENFGCPSLEKHGEIVVIDSESCNGCGVCAQICPFNAIIKEGQDGKI